MEWGTNLTLIYKAMENIAVFQLHIVPSENVSIVCNGESKELRCCTDAEIELTSYWKPNGAINISGGKENDFFWLWIVFSFSSFLCL